MHDQRITAERADGYHAHLFARHEPEFAQALADGIGGFTVFNVIHHRRRPAGKLGKPHRVWSFT